MLYNILIRNSPINTLKRNTSVSKKLWINDNITRYIEKNKRHKNTENNHEIQKYKNNIINIKAKLTRQKWLKNKYQVVEKLLRNNINGQIPYLDQAFKN